MIIAEPNPQVRNALAQSIAGDGHRVTFTMTAADTREALASTRFDLILLSASLEGQGPLRVAELRSRGILAPIVVIAVRPTTASRVTVLEAGADDILSLPIAADELRARVRATLRGALRNGSGDLLQYSDVVLNLRTLSPSRSGRNLHLTRTERDLLRAFLVRPERALSRAELYEAVWGQDLQTSSNALGLYVGYLRKKLEREDERRLIWTVRSVGYVLQADLRRCQSVTSRQRLTVEKLWILTGTGCNGQEHRKAAGSAGSITRGGNTVLTETVSSCGPVPAPGQPATGASSASCCITLL